MKIALSAACLFAATVISGAQNLPVKAERIGNRIDVTVGDQFFTSYRFEDDEKYPFFFPVNGPVSGGSVTSMRNGTYPHHSSLFFGCDRVNGGNYWQEGLERGRIVSQGPSVVESGGDRVIIKDVCAWQRPGAESPIMDRRTITIFAPSKKLYVIDFDVEMEMLMDVVIGLTNHSLFSARIAEDLTVKQGGTMVNSNGDKGEKETFGTSAPWLDFYGSRKTGTEGIAILQHPSNKWYPSKWFTRDYGFMSPTPLNWPENGTDTRLAKGEKMHLSYRVIVHSGNTEEAGIGVLFDQYCREMKEVVFVTLDPGHFHAALVQKSRYPFVSDNVYVYAPAGEDLQEHLKKIEAYNSRSVNPTNWNEIVYSGKDFLERMISEKKGNVMVTAGNNSRKTEYMLKTLDAGINVLADKPMAINARNFETLKECFRVAQEKGVLLYDIMTERFEISTILQKELSMMPEIYGEQIVGTPQNPGISIDSVHHFYKNVSGNALVRPAWFYDVTQQGEGIADVMVHLVDLVQWECFPGQSIDYTKDLEITSARHWSTPVTRQQFKLSTGLSDFPTFLRKDVKGGVLDVRANGEINYRVKGLNAKVTALWEFEAPAGGGDTHYSTMRGTGATLLIKQGADQGFIPELYIVPNGDDAALERNFAVLQTRYPGVSLEKCEGGWHVVIPASYRNGHEAHFGQVTQNYLQYLQAGKLPDWEVPGMLAKYYITTQALEIADR